MNQRAHTPRSHTALWLLVVLALIAAACSNDTDTTLEFIAADDIGNDPFTTDIAQPAPTDYTDIADELNETANNIATPQDMIRPGMVGDSRPWKRGWRDATREVTWEADDASLHRCGEGSGRASGASAAR